MIGYSICSIYFGFAYDTQLKTALSGVLILAVDFLFLISSARLEKLKLWGRAGVWGR